MNRLVFLAVLFVMISSICAEAKMDIFARSDGKRITSSPCILSYTDKEGTFFRVIRSNPIVIFIK